MSTYGETGPIPGKRKEGSTYFSNAERRCSRIESHFSRGKEEKLKNETRGGQEGKKGSQLRRGYDCFQGGVPLKKKTGR